MGQVLHKRARTTQAIRRDIQNSKESLIKAAERFNVNPKTIAKWRRRDFVDDDLLKQVYDLMKCGPTSMNSCPARIVFIRTKEAKERLKGCLNTFNIEKTMAAPVTAIIAHDTQFYERMDVLWPHADAVSIFKGNDKLITETALRNGSLQGHIL